MTGRPNTSEPSRPLPDTSATDSWLDGSPSFQAETTDEPSWNVRGLVGIAVVIGIVLSAFRPQPAARPQGPPPAVITSATPLIKTPNAKGFLSYETSLAMAPDGRSLAAGRLDVVWREDRNHPASHVVAILDLERRTTRATIEEPGYEGCGVAFSPDGQTLAVGLHRSVKLYNVETGHEQAELTSKSGVNYTSLAFSPNDRSLAAAGRGQIVVWDLTTREDTLALQPTTRIIYDVAFSPDGRYLASASDGRVVCRPVGGILLRGVACGPDGGKVTLWDAATGEEVATLRHDGPAYGVAFSPDGQTLASGGGRTAKLWDLTTRKARTLLTVEPDFDVFLVAFSSDGQTLALAVGEQRFEGTRGEVRLWDIAQDHTRAVLQRNVGRVRALAFTPDGRSLITSSRDAVMLWDLGQAEPTDSPL